MPESRCDIVNARHSDSCHAKGAWKSKSGSVVAAVASQPTPVNQNGAQGRRTPTTTGPNATLSTTSLAFRCRNVIDAGCQCITQRTTTLSNLGTAPLSIKNISTTGAFTQTNNCGTQLAAKASCTISVHWSLVNSVGLVDFIDNAAGSPQTVSLSGYKQCFPR